MTTPPSQVVHEFLQCLQQAAHSPLLLVQQRQVMKQVEVEQNLLLLLAVQLLKQQLVEYGPLVRPLSSRQPLLELTSAYFLFPPLRLA